MAKKAKRHVNIPIFIPHLGCPNACVFCDQRAISGKLSFRRDQVREEIETALATISPETETEIAFFGGSFTGIDRTLMIYLLEVAADYVASGRVQSLRLSTRPDYIDEEILALLQYYGVKTIELGLQSMDDAVLQATRRGHDASCAERGCRLIKAYGFSLIGQMMIGLPSATLDTELATAEAICRLGADGARVYPTVVFRETELCRMAEQGSYLPLDMEEAVARTGAVLDVFDAAGVPCLRVGLCAGENLSSPESVYGGPNHSAIGELARSEVFYRRLCRAIEEEGRELAGKDLTIFVPEGRISQAVGQKRKNIARLRQTYGLNRIKVLEKSSLLGYNIVIDIHDFL